MIDPWDPHERNQYLINQILKYVVIGLSIALGVGILIGLGIAWMMK